MSHPAAVAHIEVRIRHLDQFFNVIDPSPFLDQALDPDAAAFIIDAAEEAPQHAALALTVHLDTGTGAVEHVPDASGISSRGGPSGPPTNSASCGSEVGRAWSSGWSS